MEAELSAATQGCTFLNSAYALASELYPQGVSRVLAVDNTSAAAMLAGGHGSQRTRHLKIRANYVREAVEEGRLTVRHTPGSEQLADLVNEDAVEVEAAPAAWTVGLCGLCGERGPDYEAEVVGCFGDVGTVCLSSER